jgi:hypothetical protein
MPLDILVATDVLSEGLSLRRAGIIVHLDVPWTLARLEQRVGRLRRLGSPHRSIHVYAIGPPLDSSELTRVLRALQRKARLTTSVVGAGELQATLPLLGERLHHATARIIRRQESAATERLRTLLGAWAAGGQSAVSAVAGDAVALALMQQGGHTRLLAIREGGATDRVADVSDAIASLTGVSSCSNVAECSPVVVGHIDAWIDAQRGREMVRLATDTPSPAHVGILRALDHLMLDTTRADRPVVARRVESCRSLVTAARGVGAELAMQQLLRDGFCIDALVRLLESRPAPTPTNAGAWRVVAVLESVPGQAGIRAFTIGSPHPGLPQSSIPRPAPAAGPG